MRRMHLTLVLIIANIAVFLTILKLEFSEDTVENPKRPVVDITRLEVRGKNLGKPRIVEFNKNKWEILSPIKWEANSFAVNRILRNLEFLDDSVGLPMEDIKSRGQTLADYGLEDPVCTFMYGNEEKMYSLKIGNYSSAGDNVYMIDTLENENRVIVADRQVADSLMVDIDSLRSQNVLSIPKFEVSSIALALAVKDPKTQAKSTFRQVRLNKDLEGSWNFETPFVAGASKKAVDAFLTEMTSVLLRSFEDISELEAGLDQLSRPDNITLVGTNKSQTLFLGKYDKDSGVTYARLANNPTIFTLDLSKTEYLSKLEALEQELRTKDIIKFSIRACNYIEISSAEAMVTLKKLADSSWDVSGRMGEQLSEVSAADLSTVNSLLATLNNTTAKYFVSDMENEDLSKYGLADPMLKISLGFENGTKKTLLVGDVFTQGVVNLYYAKVEGEPAIYAIRGELLRKYRANALDYRSKLLYSLPENSKILSIELVDISKKKTLFSVDGSFEDYVAKNFPKGDTKSSEYFYNLVDCCRNFVVKNYVYAKPTDKSCVINSKEYPWFYQLNIKLSMPGTGGDEVLEKTILLSDRLGVSLQYALYGNEIFEISDTMINALYFLGVNSMPTQTSDK